jgi:hypothetical protein
LSVARTTAGIDALLARLGERRESGAGIDDAAHLEEKKSN